MKYKQVNSTLGFDEPTMTYLERSERAWPLVAPRIFGDEIFDLSDYNGQVILLCFWRSNNQDSINAIGNLEFFHKQPFFGNFLIIAINCDELRPNELPEQIRSHHAVHLWDDLGNIKSLYKITQFPSSVLIDKNGFIRDEKMGGPLQDWVRLKRRMIGLCGEKLFD